MAPRENFDLERSVLDQNRGFTCVAHNYILKVQTQGTTVSTETERTEQKAVETPDTSSCD